MNHDQRREGAVASAQEALNIVIKHAQAGEVKISLVERNGRVTLEISDDGLGFNTRAGLPGGGIGLAGLRERTEQIGGTLLLQSDSGGGTSVRVEVEV